MRVMTIIVKLIISLICSKYPFNTVITLLYIKFDLLYNRWTVNAECLNLVSATFSLTRAFAGQVKDIALHNEMFSVENGLLTPTFKAKRMDLRNHFRDQIDKLYSEINM